MYGIRLDEFSPNARNGTVQGLQYFTSDFGHGYFAKIEDLLDESDEKSEEIKTNSLMENPNIGDFVKMFDDQTGTTRYHFRDR